MCRFKDTDLGIKKLDFGVKRGAMAVYLTDGREVIVPVSMFPDIKRLTMAQRKDYMIMDNQYFSFEALSKIYSIKDVLRNVIQKNTYGVVLIITKFYPKSK